MCKSKAIKHTTIYITTWKTVKHKVTNNKNISEMHQRQPEKLQMHVNTQITSKF